MSTTYAVKDRDGTVHAEPSRAGSRHSPLARKGVLL